jgi:lactate dehydrogenase-like 2-hydroxyacid dehydrogenase
MQLQEKRFNRGLMAGNSETLAEILGIVGENQDVCIFGFGRWGRECFKLLKLFNINCNLIIDNDQEKWRDSEKVRITSIKELQHFQGTVIIAVKDAEETIREQIENEIDLRKCRVVCFNDIKDALNRYNYEELSKCL